VAAAAASALSGGIFGAIVAVLLLAFAGFLIYQALVAQSRVSDFERQAERCEEEVAELRRQFADALADVESRCCPEGVCPSADRTAPC
jgi:hypothetical protein